jgi:tetratricopeptide (TPR) repeat protein
VGPTRSLSLLVLFALAAAPLPSAAQVAAPRLVEEGDPPVDAETPARPRDAEPPPRASPPAHAPAPPLPARPAAPDRASPAPDPAAARPQAAPPAPAPAPTGPASTGPASQAAALPPPPPPPTLATDLARRIVPVRSTHARILELWAERRSAEREPDPARADAAGKALLAVKNELAIENLVALSAAEVREAQRALASNLAAEGVARARFAVALAPGFADAHVTLARALLFADPTKPGPVLASLSDGLAAAAREPHAVRAFYGDLASAAFAAMFIGALATVFLLVVRRLRLFFHDFHHLPIVRGTAFVQSSFLALVLLAMPILLGHGPIATAGVALLAVWAYLRLRERIVATCALLALVALPWTAGTVARTAAWTGSVAERIDDVEQGAPTDAEVAEIAARWGGQAAPAPLYAAIGRHHKRRGNLDEALRYYALAAGADDRAPEIQVNVGNVLFLKGDLEGAKAAYLAATDRAGSDLIVLGAAHYDLSKLYLRTSDMDKSAAAREKAEREAGDFLRRFGSDDDFSANRYLVDVPVPEAKIHALAAADGSPEEVQTWVRRRVAGGIPRDAWPWAGLAAIAVLWAWGLAAARLGTSGACEKCGRPACRRCDGSAAALCGQCVNVFERHGVVDARDRLRKEAAVRRHRQLEVHATRILSIVAGGAGQIWRGAPALGAALLTAILFAGFLVWFWRGIMPPPHPSQYVLLGKLALAAPPGILLWAFAIRDAFRRTG